MLWQYVQDYFCPLTALYKKVIVWCGEFLSRKRFEAILKVSVLYDINGGGGGGGEELASQ